MAKKTTYFGFTGQQAVVIIAVAAVLATLAGIGPLADSAGTATTVNNTPSGVNTGDLSLNSYFVSAVINGTTIATDQVNFNEDTNTVSLQFDAKLTDDGNTTFEIWSKNSAGTAFLVASDLESGSLSLPVTDKTMELTLTFGEAVLSGFSDTQEIEYAKVSASCNQLYDDAGEKIFPLAVRTGSTVNPNIKIDGIYDEKSFVWTGTSTNITIPVTCNVSFTGVYGMSDISDKLTMPVVFECGDDTPIYVEIIRNDAIV